FDLPMSGVRDGLIGLSISPAVQSVKSINWSSNNTSRWSTTASPSSLNTIIGGVDIIDVTKSIDDADNALSLPTTYVAVSYSCTP
ncbi:MAG: hypothetical protein ABH803_03605, partial [Candidatus Micrarchaeota archaeon]